MQPRCATISPALNTSTIRPHPRAGSTCSTCIPGSPNSNILPQTRRGPLLRLDIRNCAIPEGRGRSPYRLTRTESEIAIARTCPKVGYPADQTCRRGGRLFCGTPVLRYSFPGLTEVRSCASVLRTFSSITSHRSRVPQPHPPVGPETSVRGRGGFSAAGFVNDPRRDDRCVPPSP